MQHNCICSWGSRRVGPRAKYARLRLGLICGEGDGEDAAVVAHGDGGAGDGNTAVMRFDDAVDDGEAETSAFDFFGFGGVDAVELVEDEGEVGGGDADAAVADGEAGAGGFGQQGDGDGAAVGGVFNGVADEVEQQLFESAGIASNDEGVGGENGR